MLQMSTYIDAVNKHIEGKSRVIKDYDKVKLSYELADIFEQIHTTRMVSRLIADENGHVLAPGYITDNSNKTHTALFEIDVKSSEIYFIYLYEYDLGGFIPIEDYIKYIAGWEQEFTPYTYEITVDALL